MVLKKKKKKKNLGNQNLSAGVRANHIHILKVGTKKSRLHQISLPF